MFFHGDLQSGIALAVRESKCVACFVRGTDSQSKLWEDVFLQDDEVSRVLATKAITLRMDAQSQEAGFLSAYHPIPVTPSVVIIRAGQLILDIRAGVTKERFKEAIVRTLSNDIHPQEHPDSSSAGNTTLNAGTIDTQPAVRTQDSALPDQTTIPVPSSTGATTPGTTSTVQDLLADRRRRLEIDKMEKEAAKKVERRTKAEAQREAMKTSPDSAQAKQASYAQQQRKRQQEARLERERIMGEIESNKRDRREKEERRKALVKAVSEGNDGAGGLVDRQISREVAEPRSTMSNYCAIQVRLLDGSTIRSMFPPDRTVRTDVRAWVDEQRQDEDTPYTFKQILTPLPHRTITISEEEESLYSLGLLPSANLVILPVQSYTAAYVGDSGIISRGLSACYTVVSAGSSVVTGALGTVFRLGQTPQENATPAPSTPIASDSRVSGTTKENNIRTLNHQREGGDDRHQLYNGNQLNFEPRRNRETEIE